VLEVCRTWAIDLPADARGIVAGLSQQQRAQARSERREREAARLEAQRAYGRRSEKLRRALDKAPTTAERYANGEAEMFKATSAAYYAAHVDSQAWRDVLARRASMPIADQHGRVAVDETGQPMTATGHIEAASGERQGEGPWLGNRSRRRELVSPQRQHVVGDPPADSPYSTQIPASASVTAAALIAQAGSLQRQRQPYLGQAVHRCGAAGARKAAGSPGLLRRDDARACRPDARGPARPAQQRHGRRAVRRPADVRAGPAVTGYPDDEAGLPGFGELTGPSGSLAAPRSRPRPWRKWASRRCRATAITGGGSTRGH